MTKQPPPQEEVWYNGVVINVFTRYDANGDEYSLYSTPDLQAFLSLAFAEKHIDALQGNHGQGQHSQNGS